MLSTTRLRDVHRQEQNQRKFVCVMNEVAKTQQGLYDGYIDKEKQESVQRNQKAILNTRRNVVRQRVLKKCMKNKREEIEQKQTSTKYGKYHGVSVEQIAGQVDTYLEKNHPRIRRQQKIDKLFHDGYENGSILDNSTIQNKVKTYFDRPLVKLHQVADERHVERRGYQQPVLPALETGFFTGNIQHRPPYFAEPDVPSKTEDKFFTKRNKQQFIIDDFPDDISTQSDFHSGSAPKARTHLRPTTLPPIKIGTDNSTSDGRPNTDCITNLITRINNAKDNRIRDVKIKKEKRAKRIQAEKVHGIGNIGLHDNEGANKPQENDALLVNSIKNDRQNPKVPHDENRITQLPPLNIKKSTQQRKYAK